MAKTAVLPWMEKSGQAEVHEQIQKLARTGITRKTAFEVVDNPQKKAAMVGVKLHRHGLAKMTEVCPSEIAWLKQNGISPDEAIEIWRRADEAERNHPFWGK